MLTAFEQLLQEKKEVEEKREIEQKQLVEEYIEKNIETFKECFLTNRTKFQLRGKWDLDDRSYDDMSKRVFEKLKAIYPELKLRLSYSFIYNGYWLKWKKIKTR